MWIMWRFTSKLDKCNPVFRNLRENKNFIPEEQNLYWCIVSFMPQVIIIYSKDHLSWETANHHAVPIFMFILSIPTNALSQLLSSLLALLNHYLVRVHSFSDYFMNHSHHIIKGSYWVYMTLIINKVIVLSVWKLILL